MSLDQSAPERADRGNVVELPVDEADPLGGHGTFNRGPAVGTDYQGTTSLKLGGKPCFATAVPAPCT
jgi:hypothetical protein